MHPILTEIYEKLLYYFESQFLVIIKLKTNHKFYTLFKLKNCYYLSLNVILKNFKVYFLIHWPLMKKYHFENNSSFIKLLWIYIIQLKDYNYER